ncbi:hypothetical protein [Streptomyces sp. HD]|uniref:hypothetical protein n=1 Tax=Streptomyces sp. HD TaxID=3020892 RepID=UPI0023313FE6|nr:hypothetical protein [Streptomyces sp. HD]MDC0773905.1 hypothetical protein [Streptomyces sp. HD]
MHTARRPARTLTAPVRIPHPRTSHALPREPASLAPALPPAFEAFCVLNRDGYLDYARAHLPTKQAHQLVCSVLGELAVGWCDIVSNLNPSAKAWTLLRTRVHTAAPVPGGLDACSAQQYDALVLHCRLGYSSAAAACVMGLDASKVRYLVLSATPARRHAVRRLGPRPAAFRAA